MKYSEGISIKNVSDQNSNSLFQTFKNWLLHRMFNATPEVNVLVCSLVRVPIQ